MLSVIKISNFVLKNRNIEELLAKGYLIFSEKNLPENSKLVLSPIFFNEKYGFGINVTNIGAEIIGEKKVIPNDMLLDVKESKELRKNINEFGITLFPLIDIQRNEILSYFSKHEDIDYSKVLTFIKNKAENDSKNDSKINFTKERLKNLIELGYDVYKKNHGKITKSELNLIEKALSEDKPSVIIEALSILFDSEKSIVDIFFDEGNVVKDCFDDILSLKDKEFKVVSQNFLSTIEDFLKDDLFSTEIKKVEESYIDEN